MTTHFNIGKKLQINPFEDVKFIKIAVTNHRTDVIAKLLNDNTQHIIHERNGNAWDILYPIEALDVLVVIQWFDPGRGKFKYDHKSFHFGISTDTLLIW